MLDELRKNDRLTRAERRLASHLFRTEQQLANSLGRQPEVGELARAIGMTPNQIEDARSRTLRCTHVSLSETESIAPAASNSEPERAFDRAQRAGNLHRALERLPHRLRSVLDLSCEEDLTLRQIGARLGVTEARVCQLRKQAVDQLRHDCAGDWIPNAA
jgi:RNA polymerase sigma factor FliA